MAQVRTIEVHDQTLVVHWRNGHISEYDLLWLRDNCSCAECGNRAQGQKRVSVLQIHENPGLSHSEIGPAGKLELHWQDDHHVSTYAADWLQDHCYCDDCRDARRPRRV